MDVQSVLAHAKKFGKFGLKWIEQYRFSINVSSVRADSTSIGPGLTGGAAQGTTRDPSALFVVNHSGAITFVR